MHFNDLLIKLRTQALAAVAALTTIVGIFAKSEANTKTNWEMIAFALAILIVFWIAIWILDFCYYNRLLLGAAEALFNLENASKDKLRIDRIEISTKSVMRLPAIVRGKPVIGTLFEADGSFISSCCLHSALHCSFQSIKRASFNLSNRLCRGEEIARW